MKNKRKIRFYNIAIICLVIIESIFVYLSYKSFGNKEMILDEVNLTAGKPIENDSLFAFMIEQEDGTYLKSDLDTWPTDMVFNAARSGCIDADGNTIDGALVFDNTTHMATLTTNSTAYCYLYFSYDMAFTFYLGGAGNPPYSSSSDTSIYLNWDATDVVEYCITETVGTENCSWNTVSAKPTIENYTLPAGDGTKIIYAYLKDEDGALSKKVYDRITVDSSVPVVNGVTNTAYSFDYISVSVSATDVGGGIKSYYYKIGDGEYVASPANNYTFKALGHGSDYEVSVYVEDVAGNKSEVVTNTYSTKASGLGTILEGGMYRYQGNDVMNYICFGTDNQTDCLNNKNKYMYRIIGIKENGQMKLIKNTSISSNAWHNNYNDNTAWPDSDLFKKLNGTDPDNITPIFIDSTTYDYMAKNTTWYNKVAWTEWKYGDTTSNGSYKGETIYATENAWTNVVSAKVSLMYIHDYYYAYAVGGAPGSYSNAKTAWIFLGSTEWTMSRYGYNSSSSRYNAWRVDSNGKVDWGSLTNSYAVRPVFYLESSVEITGGTGTIADPFMIS